MRAITSFSPSGYRLYGKRMLESYIKYVDIPLTVYYENIKPAFDHPLVTFKDLYDDEKVLKYLTITGHFPVMRGIIGGKRHYTHDINTYVRKSFAQLNEADGLGDILVWFDADTEFMDYIGPSDIEAMLDGHFMGYMGRPGWRHSCASFIIWDNTHPNSVKWWSEYYALITTGNIFLLPEWHDAFWVDELRKALKVDAVNLLDGKEVPEGPANVFDILFDGKARHFKGVQKFEKDYNNRYEQLIDIVADRQPRRIIEIGTWNGKRALQMHEACPSAVYVGFDLFEEANAETDYKEKNVKPHWSFEKVMARLEEAKVAALLYRGDTKETFKDYLENAPVRRVSSGEQGVTDHWEYGSGHETADLIFIDGGHSIETIEEDLKNALDAITDGGIIIMDDYYTDMPDEELDKWGCNRVLEKWGLMGKAQVLPKADPVAGGGKVQMVKLEVVKQ